MLMSVYNSAQVLTLFVPTPLGASRAPAGRDSLAMPPRGMVAKVRSAVLCLSICVCLFVLFVCLCVCTCVRACVLVCVYLWVE